MTSTNTYIDRFYEIFPGNWLLLGSTKSSSMDHVVALTNDSLDISAPLCLLPSRSFHFSKTSCQDIAGYTDFVVFFSLDRTVLISDFLIEGSRVSCLPVPLADDFVDWPSQRQNVLSLLKVYDLSELQIETLLRSGLMNFVKRGENYWSTQKPWVHEPFQRTQLGCQFGRPEITLLHVAQSPDHHALLAWLQRLCWSSWCISGRVKLLVVANQSCSSDLLISHLQQILELQQISLEFVVPKQPIGLGESLNLGVHLAKTDSILVDLSLCIGNLSALMTGLKGLSTLEPSKLIYPAIENNLISQISPPFLFSRRHFFELGGVPSLCSNMVSVSEQMIQIFTANQKTGGVRECSPELSAVMNSGVNLLSQKEACSKSVRDVAIENCCFVG